MEDDKTTDSKETKQESVLRRLRQLRKSVAVAKQAIEKIGYVRFLPLDEQFDKLNSSERNRILSERNQIKSIFRLLNSDSYVICGGSMAERTKINPLIGLSYRCSDWMQVLFDAQVAALTTNDVACSNAVLRNIGNEINEVELAIDEADRKYQPSPPASEFCIIS